MGGRAQVDRRTMGRVGVLTCALAAISLGACGERVVSTDASNELPGSAVTTFETLPVDTMADTTTIATEPELPTTTPPATDALPTTTQPAPVATVGPHDTLPPPVPATEHQLEVLAAAFAMPGRPDLQDVPFGQAVTVGNRDLHVNVPIFGVWQYHDLDAQSRPGATPEASETATRDLLARLGIDTTGLVASFTQNGPAIDVTLAGCIVTFADDGRLASALGPLDAIP